MTSYHGDAASRVLTLKLNRPIALAAMLRAQPVGRPSAPSARTIRLSAPALGIVMRIVAPSICVWPRPYRDSSFVTGSNSAPSLSARVATTISARDDASSEAVSSDVSVNAAYAAPAVCSTRIEPNSWISPCKRPDKLTDFGVTTRCTPRSAFQKSCSFSASIARMSTSDVSADTSRCGRKLPCGAVDRCISTRR